MLVNSFLSFDNDLPFWKNLYISSYYNLKSVGVREDVNFGLDPSNVVFEKYPLVYTSTDKITLQRIK